MSLESNSEDLGGENTEDFERKPEDPDRLECIYPNDVDSEHRALAPWQTDYHVVLHPPEDVMPRDLVEQSALPPLPKDDQEIPAPQGPRLTGQ